MSTSPFFNRSEGSIPSKPDGNIVRVDMETLEIGGRRAGLPDMTKSTVGNISHVPNQDSGKR